MYKCIHIQKSVCMCYVDEREVFSQCVVCNKINLHPALFFLNVNTLKVLLCLVAPHLNCELFMLSSFVSNTFW
jgi:hypothetical protein